MNLSYLHNRSMFTQREIDYFANLGEMLGYEAYGEDTKFDSLKGRSRPMDLSWWKWDGRKDKENYSHLALHLERENVWRKDVDTIEKLFSETEDAYVPYNVIGIQLLESAERIEYLNELILRKNHVQQSKVLMIYRYNETEKDFDRVSAYFFDPAGLIEHRDAICKRDETGYWFMSFVEDYPPMQD
nr:hypothetical protein [Terribacillus saccharophilus]